MSGSLHLSTVARALVAAALVVGASSALAGCGTKADARPTALTGAALANQQAGQACAYLGGAEKRPVGSEQEAVGQAMLAHAVTLGIQASAGDARWKHFSKDLKAIGKTGGLPALDRVTAVCKQWDKDHTYYLTHSPA